MSSVEDFKVDDHVTYIPYNYATFEFEDDQSKWEYGRVTSKNDRYVFVRFGGENYSKACDPESLRKL